MYVHVYRPSHPASNAWQQQPASLQQPADSPTPPSEIVIAKRPSGNLDDRWQATLAATPRR